MGSSDLATSRSVITEVAKELCRQDVATGSSITRDQAWRPQRDTTKEGYRRRAEAIVGVVMEVMAIR